MRQIYAGLLVALSPMMVFAETGEPSCFNEIMAASILVLIFVAIVSFSLAIRKLMSRIQAGSGKTSTLTRHSSQKSSGSEDCLAEIALTAAMVSDTSQSKVETVHGKHGLYKGDGALETTRNQKDDTNKSIPGGSSFDSSDSDSSGGGE